MPVLNDNKCYRELPKRPTILIPDDLRADWLADFEELTATQLKLDNTEKNREFYDYEAKENVFGTEKESFINEFNRHAGSNSTYTLKSQLLDSLRKLYCIYTHPDTNANQQSRIASGIHEDITECSPGFNDRVNFILALLEMPHNLDELLAKARFHLVDKIARTFAEKNAQGIHVHSRFFVIAERFGYGVSAINENDLYLHTGSRDQSDDDIEKILSNGFATRFGLFGILNALREQLENLMTSLGYDGRNEEGYASGVYFKLIKIAKHFIDIKHDTDLLEMDDMVTNVIGINWQTIHLALLQKVIEEDYVNLSPEEATLLVTLPNVLDSTVLNALIPNGHELAGCLTFFSEWTIEQKANLVMAYLNNKTPKEQEAILAILDDQTPQLTMQLKSELHLQPIYYAITIQQGDVNAVKTHIEKGADINAALGLLFSSDHKHDTLYWLHDNQLIVEKLTDHGMQSVIANGKYKDKTVAEALVSTKKGRQLLLENESLQKLIPSNDWLREVQEDKKKVVNVIEGFFKRPNPLTTQLAQYIAYGDMTKAEELLRANSINLEKLFTEKVSGIQNYSRIKHKGTIFQLSLSAMDDEMCEMLAQYTDKNTIADQYQEIFPEGHEEYYAEQKPFDFTDIVDEITQSNEADLQKALDLELPNNTKLWEKLEQFRTNFTECSKQETVWNPKHLIKAFELYDQQFNGWNWNQRDLFWRQVIGYVQRFMPANIAMDVAQGLYYRIEEKEKARRSFKFRFGSDSIFPITFDSLSGLGYKFGWGGAQRGPRAFMCFGGVENGWVGEGGHLQNLCQTKTSSLQNLCSHTHALKLGA